MRRCAVMGAVVFVVFGFFTCGVDSIDPASPDGLSLGLRVPGDTTFYILDTIRISAEVSNDSLAQAVAWHLAAASLDIEQVGDSWTCTMGKS